VEEKKMNEEFIVETQQIKRAVEIINKIEDDKFPLLLQRITLKIHSQTESSFKQEEIEKLESSLELSNENVLLIIDILEFIYLQAAYEIIKPANLRANLLKIRLDESKVNAIVGVWQENGKEILDKIRINKTISLKQLKAIKWRLNLQLATNLKTKQKLPNALFEFAINENQNRDSQKLVHVEFSRDQLYEFLSKLETIQKQIDGLNA
jgi:hypothetical protein